MTFKGVRIKTWAGILIIGLVAVVLSLLLLRDIRNEPDFSSPKMIEAKREAKHYPKPEKPPLPAPSLERMKTQGCVADGLLVGYDGNVKNVTNMVNRSECYYLHRAVETWLKPPNFAEVKRRQKRITKKDIVYGMFIAEAIDKNANYDYPAEEREFEFDRMCRPGTNNDWGEHTCKPYFRRTEYRNYLRYITEQAIDNGVQVFLFGQIFYQDDMKHPIAPQIIREMREYAAFKGTSIIIGAQTNDIQDENYLKLFDFIEGGVGISDEGEIENGPCFSRWWKKEGDWCWALLWNEKFSSKANEVFLHLDWSGRFGDDMSTFARMDQENRARTLRNLHNYFISRDEGFMLPILAVLPKENGGGCHSDKKGYYSCDKKYSCDDEGVINSILRQYRPKK